jgi:hypothetical protein
MTAGLAAEEKWPSINIGRTAINPVTSSVGAMNANMTFDPVYAPIKYRPPINAKTNIQAKP